jgi:hypothetical protein
MYGMGMMAGPIPVQRDEPARREGDWLTPDDWNAVLNVYGTVCERVRREGETFQRTVYEKAPKSSDDALDDLSYEQRMAVSHIAQSIGPRPDSGVQMATQVLLYVIANTRVAKGEANA